MLPLIALNFVYVAILISLSQQNLEHYKMCETMNKTDSVGHECIESDGDCLDILDSREVLPTLSQVFW